MSGYTYCACTTCCETVVSNNISRPDMCFDCQCAGCDGIRECSADFDMYFCPEDEEGCDDD